MNELHTQVCFDALSVLNNVQYVESGMILISNVIFLKFFCTSLGLSKKYICTIICTNSISTHKLFFVISSIFIGLQFVTCVALHILLEIVRKLSKAHM